jgi:DNA-binding NarL/FixJ family response regulator
MSIRVLVCDELPIIRDGMRTLLDSESDIDVIETTDSGIHAVMVARTKRPDVVVTGLSLHGLSGLDLIKKLAKEDLDPQPRFVVFTMNVNDEIVDSVLYAGVHGMLVKQATREELTSAVRAAAMGHTTLAPQITQRLVEWFRGRGDARAEKALSAMLSELTPREREVLLMIARGLSAEEIAEDLCIGVATVRTHVYRLRCKLSLRDRAQLVSFAYRAGLMPSA